MQCEDGICRGNRRSEPSGEVNSVKLGICNHLGTKVGDGRKFNALDYSQCSNVSL